MLNKRQRIALAIDRAEEAVVDLIRAAESWGSPGSLWDQRCHRKTLPEAARHYSRSIEAITRVRS